MNLSYPMIYARIKKLLGNISNRDPADLKADMFLRSPPLRYNNIGLRALARRIRSAFSDYELAVTPDESENSKTIRDLARLVYKKLNEE